MIPKRKAIKYLNIIAIISFSLQTTILISNYRVIFTHLSFTLLITVMYLILRLSIIKFWNKDLLNPILMYSIFFAFAYYYSALYFIISDKTQMSNILFNYQHEYSLQQPLIIATCGYISIMFGAYLIRVVFPLKYPYHPRIQEFKFNFQTYVTVLYILIIIVKIWFFKQGWIGSMTTFSRSIDLYYSSAGKLSFLVSIFSLTPLIITYLTGSFYHHRTKNYTLIILIALELLISFMMGNRRELMILIMPIILTRYVFTGKLFSGRQVILVAAVIITFLQLSSTYANILGSLDVSKGISYYELAKSVFNIEHLFSTIRFNEILGGIMGWLGQIPLLDTSIRLYNGYTSGNEFSPIFDFLTRLIPFSSSIGLVSHSSELEYILFKNTLQISGNIPYLTVPLFAESYLTNGIFGVISKSFISGCIMYASYIISLKNKLYQLWYISFFIALTSGFLMSLSGALVIVFKILIIFLVYSFMRSILLKSRRENISLSSGH